MKKLCILFAALLFGSQLLAKQVDVSTAKKAAYNFLSGRLVAEELQRVEDLQLVYTSNSGIVPGATEEPLNYYYVFNAGNAGFVMVSADDLVDPVFGYSTEGGFDPNDIPENAVDWLNNYADEIKAVIESEQPASEEVAWKWRELLSNRTTANKTTANHISPLLTTKWDQAPYYNSLCPVSNQGQAVAGCVATTMAQIMKYWNYPDIGSGSYSYTDSDFPGVNISADFGNTTYKWNEMPNALNGFTSPSTHTAVATITYHAGVSVRMNYGVSSSGAFVNDAEVAFTNYFKYDNQSVRGIHRNSMSVAQWINELKNELDNSRPVFYAGYGSSGGHAWVADGYDDQDYFHINWGWGGKSDGYFRVENMSPSALGTGGGSGGFNSGQHAIVGIVPPGAASPDQYEPNNTAGNSYGLLNGASQPVVTVFADASFHLGNDVDYYNVELPAGNAEYKITARLHDANNSSNGKSYSLDATFAFSRNQISYSTEIDDVMSETIQATGGSKYTFRVKPATMGAIGTYYFEATVTNVATGISEIHKIEGPAVYPNPASEVVNVDLKGLDASVIKLVDMQGRVVMEKKVETGNLITLQTAGLNDGIYFLRIVTDTETITKKIIVAK